ncbi:hypothetical protein ACFQ14_08725 [Pseudahrensia aquimaris]|uniref:Uncharacterized protein n=1 Tax=Pseudahrensia aquimaris TaxID=744461 RepID=A0ABW3FEZ7_9HYPH
MNDHKDNGEKHQDENETRPGLWGPASWWRIGLVVLAILIVVLLLRGLLA